MCVNALIHDKAVSIEKWLFWTGIFQFALIDLILEEIVSRTLIIMLYQLKSFCCVDHLIIDEFEWINWEGAFFVLVFSSLFTKAANLEYCVIAVAELSNINQIRSLINKLEMRRHHCVH